MKIASNFHLLPDDWFSRVFSLYYDQKGSFSKIEEYITKPWRRELDRLNLNKNNKQINKLEHSRYVMDIVTTPPTPRTINPPVNDNHVMASHLAKQNSLHNLR